MASGRGATASGRGVLPPRRGLPAGVAAGVLLAALLLLAAPRPGRAYPSLFVDGYANTAADCLEHPTEALGSHGALADDP